MISSKPPTYQEEEALISRGFRYIAGLDEAGRGPLAGPVVAGAVILSHPEKADWVWALRDSKELTAKARQTLQAQIKSGALAVGVGIASHQEIDSLGIVPATRKAMIAALNQLAITPDFLLIDALRLVECSVPQKAIIHGDRLSLSIAAASIIAKVFRDQLMAELDTQFPGYQFSRHKGYGTKAHMEILGKLGPSPIHRRSFAPIRYYDQKPGFLTDATK